MTEDSIIFLTTEEYQHLMAQQSYYFTVNKDVKEQNELYFNAGYHLGCLYGTILGICCVLLPIMINNTIKRIKCLKTKKNEEEQQNQSMLQD